MFAEWIFFGRNVLFNQIACIAGRGRMSENLDKDVMSEEEAVQENIFQVSALIALLEQKGILTRQEVMNEVQGLKNRG